MTRVLLGTGPAEDFDGGMVQSIEPRQSDNAVDGGSSLGDGSDLSFARLLALKMKLGTALVLCNRSDSVVPTVKFYNLTDCSVKEPALRRQFAEWRHTGSFSKRSFNRPRHSVEQWIEAIT
jgi:hypothetical protein